MPVNKYENKGLTSGNACGHHSLGSDRSPFLQVAVKFFDPNHDPSSAFQSGKVFRRTSQSARAISERKHFAVLEETNDLSDVESNRCHRVKRHFHFRSEFVRRTE
jgi:hypothetical protein